MLALDVVCIPIEEVVSMGGSDVDTDSVDGVVISPTATVVETKTGEVAIT